MSKTIYRKLGGATRFNAICARCPWSGEGVGYFIQAVLQGSFIFAKAKEGSEVAHENLNHLRRYLESLFYQPLKPDRKKKS